MKTNVKGLLVTNGYMRSSKFDEINNMYIQASKLYNIELKIIQTTELSYGIINNQLCCASEVLSQEEIEELKFVLFLDKDIRLAKVFEKMGIRLFNSSQVIEICDDKSRTFEVLAGNDIPMPDTIIAPLVYEGTYNGGEEACIQQIEQLGYPLIIKESFGSFGQQVYKVDTKEELLNKRKELAEKPHIYQKYVVSSHGRDVRINVVGGKVVASMLRTSEIDFRANITNGGSMQMFKCPKRFETLAIKVCKLLKVDFAGVDILFGEQGEPILCEVNSNAHIKNIFECTGINVADAIMEYIRSQVEERSQG